MAKIVAEELATGACTVPWTTESRCPAEEFSLWRFNVRITSVWETERLNHGLIVGAKEQQGAAAVPTVANGSATEMFG